MRKYILKTILAGALAVGATTSCDFLDVSEELGGISSFETIFSNVDRTKKWYGQCFDNRPDYSNIWGATNDMGDAWAGYADEIYTREHNKYGKYSNWNSDLGHNHRWGSLYQSIRQCNIFLEYAHALQEEGGPDAPHISEAEMKIYKANVKFMRAIYHYYLFEMYGPIPIVANSYTLDNLPDLERSSVDEVVNWIDSELAAAMVDMGQEPYTNNENMRGVPTKGVAMAYRAKLWVYAASPLFNGSNFAPAGYPKEIVGYPEYDKNRWKTALDAALDVIAMNRYSLYYRDTDQNDNPFPGWGWYASLTPADWYQTVGSDCYSGHILERKRETNGNIGHQQLFLPPSMGANGNGGYLYHDMVAAFPMRDGKYGKDASGKDQLDGVYIDNQNAADLEVGGTSQYTFDPLLTTELDPNAPNLELPDLTNRDPRLQFMVIYDGCYMERAGTTAPINIAVGGGQDAIYQGTPTGYYVRKFTLLTSSAQFGEGGSQSRALIRYAEILLNYAEAANEYDGPSHTDNVGGQTLTPVMALREIRRCAGIEPGDDNSYGIPDEDQLSQEQLRALIRMERRLELAFEGHRFFDVRRWMVYGDQDATTTWWMHGMEVTKDGSARNGRVFDTRQYTFRKAMYLYPIPYKETVKSPDLVQNPYYEAAN